MDNRTRDEWIKSLERDIRGLRMVQVVATIAFALIVCVAIWALIVGPK